MKIHSVGKTNNGRDIINLRCGGEELELLKTLVHKAIQYTPKTFETTVILERLRNMNRCFHSAETTELINSDKNKEKS